MSSAADNTVGPSQDQSSGQTSQQSSGRASDHVRLEAKMLGPVESRPLSKDGRLPAAGKTLLIVAIEADVEFWVKEQRTRQPAIHVGDSIRLVVVPSYADAAALAKSETADCVLLGRGDGANPTGVDSERQSFVELLVAESFVSDWDEALRLAFASRTPG